MPTCLPVIRPRIVVLVFHKRLSLCFHRPVVYPLSIGVLLFVCYSWITAYKRFDILFGFLSCQNSHTHKHTVHTETVHRIFKVYKFSWISWYAFYHRNYSRKNKYTWKVCPIQQMWSFFLKHLLNYLKVWISGHHVMAYYFSILLHAHSKQIKQTSHLSCTIKLFSLVRPICPGRCGNPYVRIETVTRTSHSTSHHHMNYSFPHLLHKSVTCAEFDYPQSVNAWL